MLECGWHIAEVAWLAWWFKIQACLWIVTAESIVDVRQDSVVLVRSMHKEVLKCVYDGPSGCFVQVVWQVEFLLATFDSYVHASDIRTQNLEKLGNEDLVEGLSNHGVTSQKYLNMDD